jgi:hypothetical protein
MKITHKKSPQLSNGSNSAVPDLPDQIIDTYDPFVFSPAEGARVIWQLSAIVESKAKDQFGLMRIRKLISAAREIGISLRDPRLTISASELPSPRQQKLRSRVESLKRISQAQQNEIERRKIFPS